MSIPGLSLLEVDETEKKTEIMGFTGPFSVPKSHKRGNYLPRTDLEDIGSIYEGNFATVYKSKDRKTGQIYARKEYNFKDEKGEMWKDGVPINYLREVNILKLLKHDNIVNSHEVIPGKKLEINSLVLDYCETSLDELIEKRCNLIYQRDVIKYIMRQLFDGISYLHEAAVVHRNISCRNILFTGCGTLKISGFRTVRFVDPNGMEPEVTELMFRAPELLLKAQYGLPVDIWAAGCVFAHLLLKRPLFTGQSEAAVLSSIFENLGTPSEAIWPGFNTILKEFSVVNCFDVEQRYSDIKNIFIGLPNFSSQLLLDLLIYYPLARMEAKDVLSSPFIVDTPKECKPEKMVSILKECLTVSNLLDIPMDADR